LAIPVYRDRGTSFHADTCEPLTEAASRGTLNTHALVHGHYPGIQLPDGALPGLKTVGYWDANSPQNWGLGPLYNEGVKLMYLECGSLEFSAGDGFYTLRPDSLTITRPWQMHQMGNPFVGISRVHWVILDVGVRRPNQPWRWPSWVVLSPTDLQELADMLRASSEHIWKATGQIKRCFLDLACAAERPEARQCTSALTVRVNELLLLTLELLRWRKPELDPSLTGSKATVQIFLQDLMQNPEHLSLEWTMEGMASSCGLGPTQFIQIVKQLTNMTPGRFLQERRLSHAAHLLRDTPVSVTDAALACGFSSSQYFANVFKRRYGRTPTDHRVSQRSSTVLSGAR
jgi:AraC-like DNA-binding protein